MSVDKWPPIEDTDAEENLKDIPVESFKDSEKLESIDGKAIENQLIHDAKERAGETGYKISPEVQEKIAEIKNSFKNPDTTARDEIISTTNKRNATVEPFTPSAEYKHIPEAKHVKGFRKFLFGLTAMLGMTGAVKAEGGKNPGKDSSAQAQMEQTIKAIENNKEVNNEIRADWNDYLKWLDEQDMKGSPSLDRGGVGMKMLAEYVKTHPGTSLEATEEGVKQIQAEFIKYRKWVLDEIEAGRAQFSAGANKDNFMSWLSKYDGIPGQFTTKSQFPVAKQINTEKTTFNDGTGRVDTKTTVTNKGFAKIGKDNNTRGDTISLSGADIAQNK